MKFCEAMEALKEGSKVTRSPWKDGVYFMMNGEDVKSFQPILQPYIYNEDIMISEGWVDVDDEGQEEYKFYEIVHMLFSGKRAKLKDWSDKFIYYDNSTNSLVLKLMDIFPFTPDFSSFLAEDWITI